MSLFDSRLRMFREVLPSHRLLVCLFWFSASAASGIFVPAIEAQSSTRRPMPSIVVMTGPTRTATDSKTFKLLGDLGKQITVSWVKTAPPSLNIANTKRVVVELTLKKDGTIADDKVTLEKSSGDSALDDAGLRAVRAAAPFKTSPRSFKTSKIELHVTFDDDVAHSPLGFGNP